MPAADTQLVAPGVEFTTAPLAVREALRYDDAGSRALLDGVQAIDGVREAVVLSTCNRSEFYLVASPRGAERWLERVRRARPKARIGHSACLFTRLTDLDAVRHLFRVACELESSLLGNVHIPGQLKQAIRLACDGHTVGPVLGHTFRQSFRLLKRARTETDIGRGAASLGSAVCGLIDDHVGDRSEPNGTTVVLGAGLVARDVGRYLSKRRTDSLVFVNRTAAGADTLAREYGGRSAPWSTLQTELRRATVVIAATAASAPVVRSTDVEPGTLLIDLSVPRNFDLIADRTCATIDDITARRDTALARRQEAIPAVERLIDQQLARWKAWRAERPREELIKQLYLDESRTRAKLVEQLQHDGWRGPVHDLDRLLRSSARDMLHQHVRGLRNLAHPWTAV